jgi:hypothetical protein
VKRQPYRLVRTLDIDEVLRGFTSHRWKWNLYDVSGKLVAGGSTETRHGARIAAKRTIRALARSGDEWI